jgi:hypothetical protein
MPKPTTAREVYKREIKTNLNFKEAPKLGDGFVIPGVADLAKPQNCQNDTKGNAKRLSMVILRPLPFEKYRLKINATCALTGGKN